MPYSQYTDGNVLFAAQLNADNQTSLDLNTTTAQTVASPLNLNGAVTGTSIRITTALTLNGSTVDNPHLITSGASYSVSSTDRYVIITTGTSMALVLPTNPTAGRLVTIKDGSGAANPNISVQAGGTLIDGLSSYPITSAWGGVTVMYSGSRWLSVH